MELGRKTEALAETWETKSTDRSQHDTREKQAVSRSSAILVRLAGIFAAPIRRRTKFD